MDTSDEKREEDELVWCSHENFASMLELEGNV